MKKVFFFHWEKAIENHMIPTWYQKQIVSRAYSVSIQKSYRTPLPITNRQFSTEKKKTRIFSFIFSSSLSPSLSFYLLYTTHLYPHPTTTSAHTSSQCLLQSPLSSSARSTSSAPPFWARSLFPLPSCLSTSVATVTWASSMCYSIPHPTILFFDFFSSLLRCHY